MIDKDHPKLSIANQCELISIHRSGLYYKPCDETVLNLELMRVIDREYLRLPFYGVSRMTKHLEGLGYRVNVKRVRRLYHQMALRAIYPAPKTSKANKDHYKYPYLLSNLVIDHPNQVWASDITYIPMRNGFMYLVAIVDLYSRYVVGWGLSNTLDSDFCIRVLKETIGKHGAPEIFNSDQGVQFTCRDFTGVLQNAGVNISMDGKGRAIDNVFVERLWRSVKQENIYLKSYEDGLELYAGLQEYFDFYNNERVHQGLDYKVPSRMYRKVA